MVEGQRKLCVPSTVHALPVIRCTLPMPCRGAAKCTAGQWGQCPAGGRARARVVSRATPLVPFAVTRAWASSAFNLATPAWDSDGLPIIVRTCTRSRRGGRGLDGCSNVAAAVMTVCVNWFISGNLGATTGYSRGGATKCLREDIVGRQHDESRRRFKDRRISLDNMAV